MVASAVAVASAFSTSGSTSGPASGPASGATLPLRGLGGRLLQPLDLRCQGVSGVPEGDSLLGRGSLVHCTQKRADFCAGHQFHAGLQGGLGPIVHSPATPVHAIYTFLCISEVSRYI